jgi:hypothetical protein
VRIGSHAVADTVVPAEADGTSVGPVRIEGLAPVEARWRVSDIIYDGALSEAFMREWIFTVDLSGGEMWVVRADSR